MRNFNKIDIGMFILKAFSIVATILAMYLAYLYVDTSMQLAKVDPLDMTDKIIIACVVAIVGLLVLNMFYSLYKRFKNWD